jgi:hypothetical protein
MLAWLRWLFSFNRPKELEHGEELKRLPDPAAQPSSVEITGSPVLAIEAAAVVVPAEPSPTPDPIEETGFILVPQVAELLDQPSSSLETSTPVPLAASRTPRLSEHWIRERAQYFSAGRYAPPQVGAESFLAPDLLFRLGIDTHRALSDAVSVPSSPPAQARIVRPAARLMDDFTTTWDPPPAADGSGRVISVDPLLLTLFFGARESGPDVPAEATSEYLTEPALLAHAINLRTQLLQHWASGGAPVTVQQLYELAVAIAHHPGTALLLSHNVAKTFARGGEALRWRLINRTAGAYTDGQSAYSAVSATTAFSAPSIFPALFAPSELGAFDPGYWYRHFAAAVAAYYAASSQTRMPISAPTPEAERTAQRIVDAARQLRSAAVELTPAYRGWLWVNAWVFVETSDYIRNQQAAGAEAINSLRGVSFGLAQAGLSPDPDWRWAVPAIPVAGHAACGAIAEWLDPQGNIPRSSSQSIG